MKRSMFVLLSLIAIAALSACAPKGTPTPSVAELQATAMANAQTQIALTAAAQPTATPLPPTAMPTPIPVQPTAIIEQPIVAPPTQPAVLAPAASGDESAAVEDDECGGPLSAVEGPQADVTFTNATDGDLSLYLYSYKTKFGCGVGNVSLEPLDAVTVTVPKGCYDFYGWVTGPKDSTPAGYGCLNFDQTVTVKQDTLVFPSQK